MLEKFEEDLKMKELPFTVRELQEFKENRVWKYILSEYKARFEMVQKELVNGFVETKDGRIRLDYPSLTSRQGECLSITTLLDMVDTLIQIKEGQEKEGMKNARK